MDHKSMNYEGLLADLAITSDHPVGIVFGLEERGYRRVKRDYSLKVVGMGRHLDYHHFHGHEYQLIVFGPEVPAAFKDSMRACFRGGSPKVWVEF